MPFPNSPSNGQQATVNGIVYNYNSTKGAWIKNVTTAGTLTTGNLVITSNTTSTNTTTGALIVTGGVGVSGNINASGSVGITSTTASTTTTTGALVVAGGIGVASNIVAANILLPALTTTNANLLYGFGVRRTGYARSEYSNWEYSTIASGLDPHGATGNAWSIDNAQGAGLFNLVAGAYHDSLTNPNGPTSTTYKYFGARGASRINLADNSIIFYTGNLANAGGQVAGDIVNFTEAVRINGITGNVTIGGHLQPSANVTYDLGSSSLRWRNIYTGDLNLSNGKGDYTIVEGEDDLFLYNNRTGKTYKFVVQEVDPSTVPPKLR